MLALMNTQEINIDDLQRPDSEIVPFTQLQQYLLSRGINPANLHPPMSDSLRFCLEPSEVRGSGVPPQKVFSLIRCGEFRVEGSADFKPGADLVPLGTRLKGRIDEALSLCLRVLKISLILGVVNRFRLPVRALLASASTEDILLD